MLVLGVLATLLCAYSCAFWSWVTATPLTPSQLARAKYNANVWLTLTALSLAISIIVVVVVVRRSRTRERGFDVLRTDRRE